MKKQVILVATIVIIIAIAIITFALVSGTTIKDENEINTIKDEAYLDILVNLGNYTKDNYDESKLLDVAMQIAEKKGLFNEFSGDAAYFEYVNKEDLHLIISELTGNVVEAPIEITDFYYLYDSENEYYYYRPSTPVYYSISKINSIKEKNSTYIINCNIGKTEDTEISEVENVEISVTYNEDNSLIKYRVNSIKY